jgi:hypothetical protein
MTRARKRISIFFSEIRLPAPERRAARAERRSERRMALERDGAETAVRRHAATEAERRRYQDYWRVR